MAAGMGWRPHVHQIRIRPRWATRTQPRHSQWAADKLDSDGARTRGLGETGVAEAPGLRPARAERVCCSKEKWASVAMKSKYLFSI